MKKNFSIAYQRKEAYPEAARQFAYACAAGFVCAEFSLEGGTLRPDELTAARAADLQTEELRLPSEGVNLLWEPSPDRPPLDGALPGDASIKDESTWEMLRALYLSYFTFASAVGISDLILVPAVGYALPRVSQEALLRFETIAADAEEKGVRILFENDESEEHYEAVIRACCHGYHGVAFHPAKAWRYFGTSAIAPYAAQHLVRVALDDGKDGVFGYLPLDGETDYNPFIESVAPLHFRGRLAVSPDGALAPYESKDYFSLVSLAYDKICALQRRLKRAEGVI